MKSHNTPEPGPEDMFQATRVSHVAVSGDGSKVAYGTYLLQTAGDKKHWQNQLHVRTEDGKSSIVAEGTNSILSPLWSLDGKQLAYLTRDNKNQETHIWIYDAARHSSDKLLTFKHNIISYKWSPDGRKIAFIAEDIDRTPDRNPGQLIDVSRNYVNMRLYLVTSATQEKPEVTAITPADYSVNFGSLHADFDWSPDGKRIAFAFQPKPDFQYGSLSRIALVDLATRKITRLSEAENSAGITPAFSPDGRRLAFATTLAPSEERREAYGEILHYRRICVADLTSPAPLRFLPNTPSDSPNMIGWEKDGKGVFVYDFYRTGGAQIYFLSLEPPAAAKQVSHLSGRLNHQSLSLNSSRTTFGFGHETTQGAPEVYISAANRDSLKMQAVSRLAPAAEKPLGQVETIRWKSSDGREIEGLVIKPADYKPSRKYPLFVSVHGAPTVWTERYLDGCEEYGHQMFDPTSAVSAFLRWGFVVFQPNFRGSIAYGKEFQAANVGDWGGGDYQDIMTGVEYLAQNGIADEERMAIGGWSYGGTMTAYVAGQTDRFKAAIVGAGVTNLISMAGTSDIPELLKKNLGSFFWDNADLFWQRSAIAHVKNVHTPVLILHGGNDLRVPISQAYELYQALRLQKKPVTMLILPGEDHVIADPGVILATIEAIHDWLFKIPAFAPGMR